MFKITQRKLYLIFKQDIFPSNRPSNYKPVLVIYRSHTLSLAHLFFFFCQEFWFIVSYNKRAPHFRKVFSSFVATTEALLSSPLFELVCIHRGIKCGWLKTRLEQLQRLERAGGFTETVKEQLVSREKVC